MRRAVVVAAAVDRELADLAGALAGGQSMTVGRVAHAHAGLLDGDEVLLCGTGMGKVNAAATLAAVLEHETPAGVLCVRVGGAYPGTGLSVCDLTLASEEILADDGVELAGGFAG